LNCWNDLKNNLDDNMSTLERSQQILAGLKEAGINLVASVPDINLLHLINLLYADKEITHIPVGREEEGIGVCTGAYVGGKRVAMLMQNGGLMNSCNGLTTTALQFGIPILLLVYYAGDIGDNAFHMLGLVTEPVLGGLGIKYTVMRDPAKVKTQIAEAVMSAEASKRPVALLLTRAVL
jgi:sulfopyruvate decarboxylase subunit alpha